MQSKKEDNIENRLDFKATMHDLIEEEKPELSQEEAIKAFGENGKSLNKKQKKSSANDDEDGENSEEAEHLKRLKKELLESLERVNILAKKLFGEKEKDNLKNIKLKGEIHKGKGIEKEIEPIKNKLKNDKERG